MLGITLMPWQCLVLAVATEIDPATGWFAYREVIVTVPRQNGKTTLLLVKKIHRAVMWAARTGRFQRLVTSAQTGNDARRKLLDDELPIIEASKFWAMIGERRVRRVNGSEGIGFSNGSRIDVLMSSKSSGHGRIVDEGHVDEAFDDVDDRREQSMLPAMSTRPDAQLWVVSTQGTDESLYFNRKTETGRAATQLEDSEIAYIEFSAPQDADIDSLETWYACMPALGITIGERAIRHARDTMTEGEFRRAFLNQRTNSEERVIPLAVWLAAQGDARPEDPVTFAVDCSRDRDWASIAYADRRGHVELEAHQPGTGWLVGRVKELTDTAHSKSVALDPSGPAGSFITELEQVGLKPTLVAGRDLTASCGFFYDGIADRKLLVRPHPSLDAALASAEKRISGDAFSWSRKGAADISPLVAVTLAAWAAHQGPKAPNFFS